jgi:hypothetical protein
VPCSAALVVAFSFVSAVVGVLLVVPVTASAASPKTLLDVTLGFSTQHQTSPKSCLRLCSPGGGTPHWHCRGRCGPTKTNHANAAASSNRYRPVPRAAASRELGFPVFEHSPSRSYSQKPVKCGF